MQSFFAGKTVFVTGASSGIGEALARAAVNAGARVVLAARREDRIRSLALELGVERCEAVACDVRSEADLERAVTCARRFGHIDVVIANAGFGVGGPMAQLSIADYQRQFDTNVWGVIRTLKATLPDLRHTRGSAAVVGSANGYLSIPGHSAYCMSKHAVRSLCACLRHELREDGVSVTHLVPGFVSSEFRQLNRDGRLPDAPIDPVPSWLQASGQHAARLMLAAIAAGKEEQVITAHARLVSALSRYTPGLTSRALGLSGMLVRRWSSRR